MVKVGPPPPVAEQLHACLGGLPAESAASGRPISDEYPYVCGVRLRRNGYDRYNFALDGEPYSLWAQIDARASDSDLWGGHASHRHGSDYRLLAEVAHVHPTMHAAAAELQAKLLKVIAERLK